jgi:hypothetical protein
MPADYLPIGPGRCPEGGGECEFFIHLPTLQKLEKYGPAWKYQDGDLAGGVVADPQAVYRGLRRPDFEAGPSYCYSVRPAGSSWQRGPGVDDPLLPCVFLVFVFRGMGGYVVFDWEWRPEDPAAPGEPEGWQDDFEERLWQRP